MAIIDENDILLNKMIKMKSDYAKQTLDKNWE